MGETISVDEALVQRLPLPLVKLVRRAQNAKTPLDRHQDAYYLWEAALKLLGSVAIVEYAELGHNGTKLVTMLENLARPTAGHWWEFVRRLVPVLADSGDLGFTRTRDLVLGRVRDDLARAAGLDAALIEHTQGKSSARSTVRLTELFDHLVAYRNQEIGHGAAGERPARFYDRMARALLGGVVEILGQVDVLAGRRLIYVGDVRRQSSGDWLVERYELIGESARRIESLELAERDQRALPYAERVYIERAASGAQDGRPALLGLNPLIHFQLESERVFFLNARHGKQQAEYLCYHDGEQLKRDLATEHRELLARALRMNIDMDEVAAWAARSQAEEQPEERATEPEAEPAGRTIGEFELLSRLGHGAMGVVYRAWQPSLGRQVALKCMLKSGDPKAEARFAREIRALGRVEHPGVVKVFTSGSEADQWFFAMELVEGADLARACEQLSGRQATEVDDTTWREALTSACAAARSAEVPLSGSGRAAERLGAARLATGGSDDADSEHAPPTVRGPSHVADVVEIIRRVAEAADALHEAGVVHRDIKPGNIMITSIGKAPVLMDLGLAQLADETEGRLTRTRQFVGTLRYASPEQILAATRVDRRSDVYGLGATLWELLTLRPLFGATDATPTPDLMQTILVTEPASPRKYNPSVPRDLEAIVLKCLEKDRARRYATAAELAGDLGRFLRHEPVTARLSSPWELTVKWARRRPAIAALTTAVSLVALAGIAGVFWEWRDAVASAVKAQEEEKKAIFARNEADSQRKEAKAQEQKALVARDEAERQRQLAVRREAEEEAISKFYEDYVLAAARPKGWSGGGGKDLTLNDALNQAATKIDEAFHGKPALEADVRHTLGMTYWYLGKFAAASPLLEKAHAIRLRELGPDHLDTLTSLLDLALARWKEGKTNEAVRLARQALERRRRLLGPEHQETLWTQLNLGLFLEVESQLDEAESVLRQAIESCRRTLGPDHHHTLYGQNDLANVLDDKGKLEEALALDRQTLDGRRRSLGPDHPDTLRSMSNLAGRLDSAGKYKEAQAIERLALEARTRILGPDHMETLWSKNSLANILLDQGKLNEAAELYLQTLDTRRRVLGPEHPETLSSQHNLALVLQDQGKLDEAAELFVRTLESERRVRGPENPSTLVTQHNLARLLEGQAKLDEAEKLYLQTLETERRVRGPEHPATLVTQHNLARVLAGRGKLSEAEKLYRKTLEVERRVCGPESPSTLLTQTSLARLLGDQGKFEEAEELCRQTLERLRRILGPENASTIRAQKCLASLLADHPGHSEKAKTMYREVLAAERKTLGAESLYLAVTLAGLGSLLADNGQAAEAESLLRECLAIREKHLPANHWSLAHARSLLGGSLAKQSKFAEAEPALLVGYEGMMKSKYVPLKHISKALNQLIELYEKWGKPEQADSWRKKPAASGK
jgi:serine/threonine protein kinase